ncbi:MAG: WxL domain-containing protein [Armatimonadetes bacterium]|nr:WxL domain-containing protein [Armatimonadota bacterium]
MKRFLLAAAVLLALGSGPAAAQAVNPDATINVIGAALTIAVNAQDLTFPDVTLDGTDQSVIGTASPTFTLTDATGTGNGWNVTVQSADFDDGGGNVIPASGFTYTAQLGNIVTVAGNAPPTETGNAGSLDVGFQSLTAAVNEGMGSYTWQPNAAQFGLVVPAETVAGTYTAMMTVTIASGP